VDLEFSQDELELRDNVRSVLAATCPPSFVREVFEGKADAGDLWRHMTSLFWPALGVPEAFGGLGRSFVEVTIVAEELGRAVAPGPYLATATQFVPTVVELGSEAQAERYLTRVAAGELTGTVALAEHGRWDVDAVGTVATPQDGGWVLRGAKSSVLDGDAADEVVVVARAEGSHGDDGLGVFIVPGERLRSDSRHVVDPSLRVCDVAIDGVEVPTDRVLAAPGDGGTATALARMLDLATVAMAATTVGACRRIFEMTLDYARVREQFGRPIGSFQALKHRIADMFSLVERATAVLYFAALTIADDDPRRHDAASVAKSAAGDCQRAVVEDGLQLHGGIGMTWEYDLHLLLKRAKSGDALFGTATTHRGALARSLQLVAR
jgi:alkylation response protein AidB-like acyl-CoA dehydrogenase